MRDGHFACGNLLGRGSDEAEFAMAEAFLAVVAYCAHGRAEDAAGHGTPGVHIAAAGRGVEGGTGGFVGEVREFFLILEGFSEYAGVSVAGEIRAVFRKPGAGAGFDFGCERGTCGAELVHSGAEARGIEGVDGECAVAALRAADAAGEKRSGAARCFGKRSVYDLDEFGIARGKGHERKDSG